MDENFLNFASQVMNDWTDDIKRIADALERISPPQWEVCDISFDSAQINVMAEDGWTLFHVFEASFGTTAVLRRPRRAPAAEVEEYRCECGAYGESERNLTVEHRPECYKGIPF